MVPMYQAAELEKVTALMFPIPPKIGYITIVGFFLNFKSRLSRYSKLVHPSTLAFILLLLENFLFTIALFFGGGFHGA
jgi:hypothetical protein